MLTQEPVWEPGAHRSIIHAPGASISTQFLRLPMSEGQSRAEVTVSAPLRCIIVAELPASLDHRRKVDYREIAIWGTQLNRLPPQPELSNLVLWVGARDHTWLRVWGMMTPFLFRPDAFCGGGS